jgi:hypothetical protein
MKLKRTICPHCKQPTLTPGMYGEDGASVFDQKCFACGHYSYAYIGRDDGPDQWEQFRKDFPTVEIDCDFPINRTTK